MIAVVPALSFLGSLCGDYACAESEVRLRIWKCGHGVAIEVRDGGKSPFTGLVGAHGITVECFALIGMPNVLRLAGDLASKTAIRFECDDMPVALSIVRDHDELRLSITFSGVERVAHAFRRA